MNRLEPDGCSLSLVSSHFTAVLRRHDGAAPTRSAKIELMNVRSGPRLAVAIFAVALSISSDHKQIVKLQEETLAAQRNYSRADDPEADIKAVVVGTTQQQVIDKFGLPVMVHTEGRRLCAPWDSCTYPASAFIYRSTEASTCTITFAEGKVDKSPICEPFLQPVILGPGDVDPKTGRTGNL